MSPLSILVKNNWQVKEELRYEFADPSDKFVTVDAKVFYLTGNPTFLTEQVRELFEYGGRNFPGRLIDLVAWAVIVLCDNQYIVSQACPGRIWKTVLGSGMGLYHSHPSLSLAVSIRLPYPMHGVLLSSPHPAMGQTAHTMPSGGEFISLYPPRLSLCRHDITSVYHQLRPIAPSPNTTASHLLMPPICSHFSPVPSLLCRVPGLLSSVPFRVPGGHWLSDTREK